MRNTNTKSFSLSNINWTASAVNRYYHCSAKIRESEAKGNLESTTNKWYKQLFRAEDRMKAMGI